MTIRNRVAIQAGGTWYFPDPRGLSVIVTPLRLTDWVNVATADPGQQAAFEVINAPAGFVIDISGQYVKATDGAGLTHQHDIRNWFVYAKAPTWTGAAKTVQVCAWLDSGGVYTEIYRDCMIQDGPHFARGPAIQPSSVEWSVQLRTGLPIFYVTATDSSTPGVSDYEDLLIETEAGTPDVIDTQANTESRTFPGIVQITDADNVGDTQRAIFVPGTGTFNVLGITISGSNAAAAASGSTTARVSTTNYESDGSYLAVSLAYSATQAHTAGSFAVTGGSWIYVYFTASASHANVTIAVEIKPA